MCGIMGMADVPGLCTAEIASRLRRMSALLEHRGPDDGGGFYEPGIGLGHVRLSILDIEHGAQPMSSPDGSAVVVFNGEIYNYRDLWCELESKGHRFRTHHSDTEVILNGYLEWGLDVFSRLEGMFAVGIWDRRTKMLVLARDRMGIKPLYYAHPPEGGVIFASEPKAILQCGLMAPAFDAERLAEYFTHRAVAAPRTLWRGVLKLPAAHILSCPARGAHSVARYWTPSPSSQPRLHRADAVETVEAELRQAVKSHLIADVPVGIFLSGGVDSSLVAAFASQLSDVQAFTIGTRTELDEIPFAAEVAHRFGMTLHSYYVEPHDFIRALDDWIYFNDDPVSNPSALALLLLSRAARQQGVKAILTGEGSDELFCGYSSYVRYLVLDSIKQLPLAAQGLALLRSRLDGRTVDYLEQPDELKFIGTGHVTTRSMRRQMFVDIASDVPPMPPEIHPRPVSRLREALLFDQMIRLPNDILAGTDRATMAAGLEARVPYLDRRVIDVANALDDGCCLNPLSLQTKWVLKRILRKYLPSHLVYRKKLGFDLPIGKWLRTQFRVIATDFLADRRISGMNYCFWTNLYDAHCNGERDYAAPLWAWFVLERWYRRWGVTTTTGVPPEVPILSNVAMPSL